MADRSVGAKSAHQRAVDGKRDVLSYERKGADRWGALVGGQTKVVVSRSCFVERRYLQSETRGWYIPRYFAGGTC